MFICIDTDISFCTVNFIHIDIIFHTYFTLLFYGCVAKKKEKNIHIYLGIPAIVST